MLCFFQAVMLTAQYRYFKSGKSKWIWLTAGAFLMGWLTKSIAICFVLPGIWMLGALIPDYRKRIFSIHQTLAFSSAIGVIFIYYMLRNHYQPGYIDMVNQEEWLGRFGKHPQANHDLFYYLKGFYHDRLKGFVFPVLLSMLWAIGSRQKSNFQKLGFLVIIFTLPILSLSHSKNYWYDLPLLFPMALCMALLFDYILSFTKKHLPQTEFFIGMVALFFITKNAWKISQSHKHFGNPNKKEILVQHLKQDRFDKTIKYGVFCNAFNTDILFYLNNLKLQGYSFTIVETSADLRKYNKVMMAKEDEEAWKKQRSGSIGKPDLEIFSH